MPNPLSAETTALVKATAPVLAEHGLAITQAMYRRLFVDERIKALFNHANQGEDGKQAQALAAAILAYAENVDNLAALAPAVERIAQKHVGYDILPEHYPFVAKALLGAIEEVLGDAATDAILAAWAQAYWFLADILMAREAEIRGVLSTAEGGWTGWRRFIVTDKTPESSVITSFTLRPVDEAPVLRHKAGQYLTLRYGPADRPDFKRNYSISSAPNGEFYRISVKRMADGQGGSKHLHDLLEIGDVIDAAPPTGDFFLPEKPERPVVLLSGGVGLTPMVSMIEEIAERHPDLEAHFVHGALNSEVHAMDDLVRSLAQGHGGIKVATFYSEPLPGDAVGKTHDAEGFISVDWLGEHTPLQAADVYLCGPKPFLKLLVGGLRRAGVPRERIHYEFFGPADEELAA